MFKFWNLQKVVIVKKNVVLDVEFIYVFWVYRGLVLVVVMGSNSEYCYSGGVDVCIYSWKILDFSMDFYDGYDLSVLSYVLEGYGDVVWGLVFSFVFQCLVFCFVDGIVCIWDFSSSSLVCFCIFFIVSEYGVLILVVFISIDFVYIVVFFCFGDIVLYDLEVGGVFFMLEFWGSSGLIQIN